MNREPVFVTKPSLAKLSEYHKILEGIWERGILTHDGPLVQEFEKEVCKHFKLPSFVAVTNGTIALQMAIKALDLKGEIITTPFTWIATVSAIKWEGCNPVFCDIDPETLNMDPDKIEACITENTVAIMPVHVFGNPCKVDKIDQIAKKYNLKVIYDAAHAIGSEYQGESLLTAGDISATSLHATKILNTAEGGACITKRPALEKRLKQLRFFGHDDEKKIVEDGFNGKMTEIHAGLGLANLKTIDAVLADRKQINQYYRNGLKGLNRIRFQKIELKSKPNYAYFPIIVESEQTVDTIISSLEQQNIYARRYFYPSVNRMSSIVDYQEAPVAEAVSERIICLPAYTGLQDSEMDRIMDVLKNICHE